MAAFHVIDSGVDVVARAHAQISATKFQQRLIGRQRIGGGPLAHARIRGHHGVHVGDVIASTQSHVATAQRAHAFKKVAVVHPP